MFSSFYDAFHCLKSHFGSDFFCDFFVFVERTLYFFSIPDRYSPFVYRMEVEAVAEDLAFPEVEGKMVVETEAKVCKVPLS
jgi:hypothetical protein